MTSPGGQTEQAQRDAGSAHDRAHQPAGGWERAHQALANELANRTRRAAVSEGLARWTGYILVAGSIIVSFAGAVIGLQGAASPQVVGTLSACAGFLASLNAAFKFDARADWFCLRKNAYRAIERRLMFAATTRADLAAIAGEIGRLQESSARDFPRVDAPGLKPAADPRRQDVAAS